MKRYIPVKFDRKKGIGKYLEKSVSLCSTDWRGLNRNQGQNAILTLTNQIFDYLKDQGKCVTPNELADDVSIVNLYEGVPLEVLIKWGCIRKLHPIESERLQTLPDNYTASGIDQSGKEVMISDTQRYKAIGNGWTVDVVSHILKHMKDFPNDS